MIIAGLDIETTGLLTPDHQIIEIYISLWKDKNVYGNTSNELIRNVRYRRILNVFMAYQ